MLSERPREARLEARTAAPRATTAWEEWEIPREAGRDWPEEAKTAACRVVGGADCAAEGDRCLDRGKGRVRVSLRQALRRQFAHPCRRPVHGREPVAAPRCSRRRRRHPDRRTRRPRGRLERFRADGARKSEDIGRAAGAQGGPHRLYGIDAVAGQAGLRRRAATSAEGGVGPSAAPRSFSAPNSARCSAPISSTRRARRPTPGSTW